MQRYLHYTSDLSKPFLFNYYEARFHFLLLATRLTSIKIQSSFIAIKVPHLPIFSTYPCVLNISRNNNFEKIQHNKYNQETDASQQPKIKIFLTHINTFLVCLNAFFDTIYFCVPKNNNIKTNLLKILLVFFIFLYFKG